MYYFSVLTACRIFSITGTRKIRNHHTSHNVEMSQEHGGVQPPSQTHTTQFCASSSFLIKKGATTKAMRSLPINRNLRHRDGHIERVKPEDVTFTVFKVSSFFNARSKCLK